MGVTNHAIPFRIFLVLDVPLKAAIYTFPDPGHNEVTACILEGLDYLRSSTMTIATVLHQTLVQRLTEPNVVLRGVSTTFQGVGVVQQVDIPGIVRAAHYDLLLPGSGDSMALPSSRGCTVLCRSEKAISPPLSAGLASSLNNCTGSLDCDRSTA